MQWTSDSRTLLYSDLEGEISAVELDSRTPRALAKGTGGFDLVETSSGDVVFFLRPVAGTSDELECVQAPLLAGELGTPRVVTTEPACGVVSAHGEAVALWLTDGAFIIDIATGASRLVPMDMPMAFAPDAASLFGRKGSDYVMSDASGVVTPLLDGDHTEVKAVIRWEADFPSAMIVDNSLWLDVASGEERPLLPGIQTNAASFAGVSGDALRPDAAYVWSEECLGYAKVGQPPEEVCSEPLATLWRVDLETQAVRAIASMPERRDLAVSPDALSLATYNDEAFPSGKPQIDLKRLPPL